MADACRRPEFLGPLALIFPRGARRRVSDASAAATPAHRVSRWRERCSGPSGSASSPTWESSRSLADLGVVLLLFTVGLELSLRQPAAARARSSGSRGRSRWSARSRWSSPSRRLGGYPLSRSLLFGYMVVAVVDGDRPPAPARSPGARLAARPVPHRHPDLPGPGGRPDAAVDIRAFARGGSGGPMPILLQTGKTVLTAGVAARGRALRDPPLHRRARRHPPEGDLRRRRPVPRAGLGARDLLGGALARRSGAFLAGLVLSESEYGHQALADITSFRDAFNAIFFVSIGMLFNPRVLLPGAPARRGPPRAHPGLEDGRRRRGGSGHGLRLPRGHRRRPLARADRGVLVRAPAAGPGSRADLETSCTRRSSPRRSSP